MLLSLADAQTAERITTRLRKLQPDDTRRWGRMSPSEMLCHLRQSFLGAMSTGREWGTVPPQPLPPRALKFAALRLPVRWPREVPTVSALERGAPLMRAGSFPDERDGVLLAIGQFRRPEQVRGDHPMFGSMQFWDWMRWGYLHTDHHLRQFGR